jgi:hypothetical protein
LGEVKGGLGAKAVRHSITLTRRLQNKWEERGHLLWVKLLRHDLRDARKLQRPANPRGEHSALAAPVEVAQRRHDGLASQLVA